MAKGQSGDKRRRTDDVSKNSDLNTAYIQSIDDIAVTTHRTTALKIGPILQELGIETFAGRYLIGTSEQEEDDLYRRQKDAEDSISTRAHGISFYVMAHSLLSSFS